MLRRAVHYRLCLLLISLALQVAQSLGFLWLGGVITFWLKSSFKV